VETCFSEVITMLGWLLHLITLLIVLTVVTPFSVIILGLAQWYLCFLPLAIAISLFWVYEAKRLKEKEALAAPEVTSEERRKKALEEWVEIHKEED